MRRFYPGVIALLLIPWLVACGRGTSGGATTAPAATTSDGVDRARLSRELVFLNWNDYLDPTILEQFEREYGVTVRQEFFLSNEEMIEKVSANRQAYDLVAPSDYAVEIMIAEGLLAPLDKANIPHIQYINPTNLDQYFDPGNAYSLPYLWGATGIAYNQAYFIEQGLAVPDSWAYLLDPAKVAPAALEDGGYARERRLGMLDDEREVIGAALVYLGLPINDTTPASLEQAARLLSTQKDWLLGYNSENALALVNEEIVLAQAFSGTAAQARVGIEDKPGNEDIQFVIPREGGTIWQDNLAIVAERPEDRKYTAEVFINFMHRPEIYARNVDYTLFLSANTAADQLISAETRAIFDAGFRPTPAQIGRLQWIQRNAGTAVFSELWTRLRAQ